MRPMHAHGAIGHDPTRIEGQHVSRSVLRRAWDFARPYKLALIGFLAAIITGALMALIPPLLFRRIIDVTLPNDDRSELLFLALLVVVAALVEAAVSLFERRQSAQIGEGVIFDLRVALFDHVQRLPISFFTRTQTGALVSRLNNDVIGAQRALTGTLGSVVSNVIVLTTTLIAMLALDWKVTLLALLLLPLFLIPAKRVGRKIQAITRESMDHNAALELDDDRTIRCFRSAAGEAVRLSRRGGRRVLGPGAPGAGHRHQERRLHPHLPHRAGPGRSDRHGRGVLRGRQPGHLGGHHGRHVGRPGHLRHARSTSR